MPASNGVKRKQLKDLIKLGLCLLLITGLLGWGGSRSNRGGASCFAEKKKKKPLDPTEKAVKKATTWLVKKIGSSPELTMLALIQAGVSPKRPEMRKGIKKLLTKKLGLTYSVGCMAMALEALDRKKYQERIARCAQALMNYQCTNGQWDYTCSYSKKKDPKPVVYQRPAKLIEVVTDGGKGVPASRPFRARLASPLLSGEAAPNHRAGGPLETKAVKTKENVPDLPEVKVTITPKGQPVGDNSCTQFALLGLRSAARSGVVIPDAVWQKSADWLVSCQSDDGGWSYSRGQGSGESYGSMTVAGICGLVICQAYLKQDFLNNSNVQDGMRWLDDNFAVDKNPPELGTTWHYYYVYGLERVGAVSGLDKFGDHDWYQAGVEYLLAHQKKNGSWNSSPTDTAFALLFICKGTPDLKLRQEEKKQ